MRRWRQLHRVPTAPEALGITLAAYAIVRGLGIILFDGLTSPTYAYALRLAPEWVWGAIPLSLGLWQAWAIARDSCPHQRRAAMAQASWWLAWVALVIIGRPTVTLVPFVAPWLMSAAACGWIWLLLGWGHDRPPKGGAG